MREPTRHLEETRRKEAMRSRFDALRRIGGYALAAINVAVFCGLSYRWFLADTIDTPPMTRSDYLDLSLSLLSVMLAAITIFLAIAAIFAYYDIRRAAERMAEETTISVYQRVSQGEPVSLGNLKVHIASPDESTTSKPDRAPRTADLGSDVTKHELDAEEDG
jgi:hypothetical protein